MYDKSGLNRRQFCGKMFSAGSVLCIGCSNLLAFSTSEANTLQSQDDHKFQKKSEMTYEEVFEFAFQIPFVPFMRVLVQNIGLDLLKESTSKAVEIEMKKRLKKLPNNDLATFTSFLKNPSALVKNSLTFQIFNDTETTFEMRVTECLWSNTFRDVNAEDIGYSWICHSDYASAKAFNPKMRLIRDKTLMQGHDCCNHRYVIEA
jgi:hypothetical protein